MLACFATIDRVAAVDDFSAAPCTIQDGQTGVLLLHDGGVLTGQISHAADRYVVTRAGAQMQVPARQVQFIGHSLREAYEFRRDRTDPGLVEAKLALADWCLRHNLLVEAGNTLAAVCVSDPEHPRLMLLQRRLTAAQSPPGPTKVNATASSPRTQPSSTERLANPAMSPDLPAGVLEQFTRKVQPVLVNNCTTSKCHEPSGSQSFQLNRASLRGEANRRTTMQNLSAVLALVDHENPNASPLLVVPRQTHGGMTAPVFGPRHDQAFKHLAEWVDLISAPPMPPEELVKEEPNASSAVASKESTNAVTRLPGAAAPPSLLVTPPAKPMTRSTPATRSNSVTRRTDTAVEPASATEAEPFESLRGPHRLRVGVKAERWQPRDPFDPEIFNRRYRNIEGGPAD